MCLAFDIMWRGTFPVGGHARSEAKTEIGTPEWVLREEKKETSTIFH
jgi:hypothetical protein